MQATWIICQLTCLLVFPTCVTCEYHIHPAFICISTVLVVLLEASLSNDDDDGSEKVVKKMNLRLSNFIPSYVDPLDLICPNIVFPSLVSARFFPRQFFACALLSERLGQAKCTRFLVELNSWGLYSASKRERKIRHRCSRPGRIRRFHVEVSRWTWKKLYKKRDTRAGLLFYS